MYYVYVRTECSQNPVLIRVQDSTKVAVRTILSTIVRAQCSVSVLAVGRMNNTRELVVSVEYSTYASLLQLTMAQSNGPLESPQWVHLF